MLIRQGPEDIRARLAPQHIDRRIGRLVSDGHQRHHDGNEDPLQGSQHHHPGKSGEGPDELHSPDLQDGAKLRRFDQPDGVDDDHRRQGGFRHQPDERGEQEHRHQRGPGGD